MLKPVSLMCCRWRQGVVILVAIVVAGRAAVPATLAAVSLAEAVDRTNLVWSTGGNAVWLGQTTVTHDSVDAAQTGAIGDGQESWLETTVTGPGPLSFWWKVSSELGYDELEFSIDGGDRISITGMVDWEQRATNLTSGTHVLRWSYVKDPTGADGLDRGWLDQVSYTQAGDFRPMITTQPASQTVGEGVNVSFSVEAVGVPPPAYQWFFGALPIANATNATLILLSVTTNDSGPYTVAVSNYLGAVTSSPASLTVTVLAEALETANLVWITGGDAGWFGQTNVTHDGVDAAASGPITNAQQSWVQTIVTGPGTLSFWWKVSSETNFDGLQFLVNGTTNAAISGETGWQMKTYDLPSGSQALRWRYLKDGSFYGGQDTGWLDQVLYVPLPTLSVSDAVVTEGNSGTSNAIFTVSLSAVSDRTVNVNFAAADGTAVAGSDFVFTNGLLTFAPGTTNQTITVRVNGDLLNEANETLFVNLSNPTNATLADGQGLGTILNDDAVPALSINDVTVTEGNSGTTNAVFTVSLSAVSGQTVTVNFATADGAAVAASDYVSTNGLLTFAAGATNQTVTVRVNGDLLNEGKEKFFVNLSNPTNATISDSQGLGTINNDDPPAPVSVKGLALAANGDLLLSIGCESNRLYFLEASTNLSAWFVVTNLTSSNTTLTFVDPNAGDYQRRFYRITTGEPVPALFINDVVVAEGDNGTTNAVFTVGLSAVSDQTVTVNFATADGTAVAGSDYVSTNGLISFAPGTTNQTVTVRVNGDLLNEANETFFVNLSNPTNAIISDGQGLGTINNDDPPPAPVSVKGLALAANGDLLLSIGCESNRLYFLEASTNLSAWTAVTNLTSSNTTLNFVDPNAGVYQRRFYRITAGQ